MSSHQEQFEIATKAAAAAVRQFVYSPEFREALNEAIDTRLKVCGIDPEDAVKVRRDMVQLRDWNEFWDFVRRKGVGSTVTWLVTGALASLAIGIGVIIGRH